MSNIYIQPGDLVVFDDNHGIYCGDCTDPFPYIIMEKYFDKKAKITFTSPPYNVGANNTSKPKYQDDKKKDLLNTQDYTTLLNKSLKMALQTSEFVFFNVAHVSGNKLELIDFMHENKYFFVDTIIWVKTTSLPALEPRVLNSDFEYIYVFAAKEKQTRHINVGEEFRGTKSNVISLNRNTQNEYSDIHSALFPLELCEHMIKNFTEKGDRVLDTFSGLATNLIACMRLGRNYYGVEKEPLYVQESIKRYMEYTTDRNMYIVRGGKTIEYDEFKKFVLDKQISIFD